MVSALVLTGAPGSGKSSVLEAIGTRLEIAGQPYGAIESEQLGWGSPWLPAADWIAQLTMVLAYQRRVGRRLFLIAATTETAGELSAVVEATSADRVLVACLSAPPDVVAARIERREPDAWPGKRDLIAHARELAESIPRLAGIDLVLETEGREAGEIAGGVVEALASKGLLQPDP